MPNRPGQSPMGPGEGGGGGIFSVPAINRETAACYPAGRGWPEIGRGVAGDFWCEQQIVRLSIKWDRSLSCYLPGRG